MDSKQWNSLSKPKRVELLKQAGLSPAMAQASWQALTPSERKKLTKGKGWHEAATDVPTRKGIKRIAKRHHEVAVKKGTGGLLDKPIKPKEEKLSERRYKEWYDKGFAEAGKKNSIYKDVKSVEEDIEMVKESNRTPAPEVYAGIPNLSGLESLAKLEGIRDGLIARAKKVQVKTTLKEKIAKLEADNWDLVHSDLTQEQFTKGSKLLMQQGYKMRGLIDKERKTYLIFMKPMGYKREWTKEMAQEWERHVVGKQKDITTDESKFVEGIFKQASEGATVKEFGTRLYVWRGDEPYATKHITESEYAALKAIIKGIHQLSRADALKNLQAERDKEAKIVQEIEERKEQPSTRVEDVIARQLESKSTPIPEKELEALQESAIERLKVKGMLETPEPSKWNFNLWEKAHEDTLGTRWEIPKIGGGRDEQVWISWSDKRQQWEVNFRGHNHSELPEAKAFKDQSKANEYAKEYMDSHPKGSERESTHEAKQEEAIKTTKEAPAKEPEYKRVKYIVIDEFTGKVVHDAQIGGKTDSYLKRKQVVDFIQNPNNIYGDRYVVKVEVSTSPGLTINEIYDEYEFKKFGRPKGKWGKPKEQAKTINSEPPIEKGNVYSSFREKLDSATDEIAKTQYVNHTLNAISNAIKDTKKDIKRYNDLIKENHPSLDVRQVKDLIVQKQKELQGFYDNFLKIKKTAPEYSGLPRFKELEEVLHKW